MVSTRIVKNRVKAVQHLLEAMDLSIDKYAEERGAKPIRSLKVWRAAQSRATGIATRKDIEVGSAVPESSVTRAATRGKLDRIV